MRGAANRTYVVSARDVQDILELAEFEAYDMDSHEVVSKAIERFKNMNKAFLPSHRKEHNGDRFAVGWNECVDALRRNLED